MKPSDYRRLEDQIIGRLDNKKKRKPIEGSREATKIQNKR